MEILPASVYAPIFYNLVLLLVLFKCGQLYTNGRNSLWILALFLIFFLGLRPVSGRYFVDTANYAQSYDVIAYVEKFEWDKEWVFNGLMFLFAKSGLSVHAFFFIVEVAYIGFSAWACKRLFDRYGYLAFLVVIGSFSFYSYGINGIRNGMAAAIMILALSYLDTNKWKAVLWAFVAVNVHNSMLLPVAAMIACLVHNNTKHYFYFWVLSIVVSATVGSTMETLIAGSGLVEDDRFTGYLTAEVDKASFSSTGFRWDFLLYSCVPILIGYYYVVKKGFRDRTYLFFLNTYILSNSFWVMVIRANFSNRFAYLSWFLYGIVLVYPFLKCEYVKGRDAKLRLVLLGNVAFTYFMWLIGK